MRVRIVSKSSAARGRDIKPSRDTGIILFPSRRGTLFASIFGKAGGCTRTRTLDPLIKSQLLYQLSYAPAQEARSITKRRRLVERAAPRRSGDQGAAAQFGSSACLCGTGRGAGAAAGRGDQVKIEVIA